VVIRHLAIWWFLNNVEQWVTERHSNLSLVILKSEFAPFYSPHMHKLVVYGDSLRKEAGFVKVMKSMASKNAKFFKSRAGRHAHDLERVAMEVIRIFDNVYEETADAVEEFLARCEWILNSDQRSSLYLMLIFHFSL
jgi:phosphatidylethanolamine N-methyltransferase